ncbi:MAG: hypothetical protein R3F61_07830 [Myxococcota bacterium]
MIPPLFLVSIVWASSSGLYEAVHDVIPISDWNQASDVVFEGESTCFETRYTEAELDALEAADPELESFWGPDWRQRLTKDRICEFTGIRFLKGSSPEVIRWTHPKEGRMLWGIGEGHYLVWAKLDGAEMVPADIGSFLERASDGRIKYAAATIALENGRYVRKEWDHTLADRDLLLSGDEAVGRETVERIRARTTSLSWEEFPAAVLEGLGEGAPP